MPCSPHTLMHSLSSLDAGHVGLRAGDTPEGVQTMVQADLLETGTLRVSAVNRALSGTLCHAQRSSEPMTLRPCSRILAGVRTTWRVTSNTDDWVPPLSF